MEPDLERHRGVCQSVHVTAVRGHSRQMQSTVRGRTLVSGNTETLGVAAIWGIKRWCEKKSLMPACEGPGRVCKGMWT